MAIRGPPWSPFYAALQLTFWALAFAPYLRGRLLLAGRSIRDPDLTAGDILDLTLVLIVDGVGEVNRTEVLDRITDQLKKPPWPTRDSWGTDPTAQAGQRAMMALAGGPAPMRDPNKPRPSRRRPEETVDREPEDEPTG